MNNTPKSGMSGNVMDRRAALALLAGVAVDLALPRRLWANAPASQPEAQFHLYLLIGQSNMAGRGLVDAASKVPHPRVLMLNKNREWVAAIDPLHFDKTVAGVGPGLAFGKQMAEANPQVRIGLIPCAVGGTPISAWVPGKEDKSTRTHPYDDMLERVRVAMQTGVLKGILWHRGNRI